MEYLDDDDEWGGIVHKDPYIGNWGLYVGRPFNGAPLTGTMYIDSLFGSITDGIGTWDDRLSFGGSGALDIPGWTVIDPENKVDLFKAFAAGNGVLGLRVNYAHIGLSNSDEVNNTSPAVDISGVTGEFDGKASVIGIGLGYGLKDLGPFNALDIGVGYKMGSLLRDEVDNQPNTAGNASAEYRGEARGGRHQRDQRRPPCCEGSIR